MRLLPLFVRATTIGLLCGVVMLPGVAWAAPVAPVQLNASDVALLNAARQAGLWEIPASQMAMERGSQKRVREIAVTINEEHIRLDELTVAAANELGAQLPSTPTPEQEGWLAELRAANGPRFDQIYVDRLRAAHGKVFAVIGAVRAATRNPVIRKLADDANAFVLNHMQLLESTGLVRFIDLPPAALPADQDTSAIALAKANAGGLPNPRPAVVWLVLLGTLSLAGFATLRIVRGR